MNAGKKKAYTIPGTARVLSLPVPDVQPFDMPPAEGPAVGHPDSSGENTMLNCPVVAPVTSHRSLHSRVDLSTLLKLTSDQVDKLAATGQLTPILICGEERFDSREISALIHTYMRVAARRKNNA